MRKITLACMAIFCFVFSWQTHAQFTESFDTEIPATWTVLNEDGGTYTWEQVTNYPHLGAGHARIHWESEAHNDFLITPQIAVIANTSDRISFYAGIDGTFYTETFEIRVSTTGTAAADFTTIASETATTDAEVGDYTLYTYDLSAYIGSSIYVAIVATDTNQFYLAVDEFVNDGIPNCTPVVSNSETIMPDCGTSQFSIDVEVATVGDGTVITDGLGGSFPIVAGTVTAGPYADGDSVTLTVEHSDGACNFSLGDFTYNCPPANDECANAIALTVNEDLNCAAITSGTTLGATDSGIEPTFDVSGTPSNDVWYSFVATSVSHTISLDNIVAVEGTSTDMGIAVFDGSATCSALTLVGSSDPHTYSVSGLTNGTTYFVAVYGWSSSTPAQVTFDICVGTPPPPPANDDCAGAVALTVNADYNCGSVTSGTVASATDSGANDETCYGTPDDDVWYSFVATATAHRVSLTNLAGSATDMYMTFYDATAGCGALGTSIDCSDPQTANLTDLTIGTTYFVQVYTYTSTAGQDTTFDICVGTPPPPPANDDCAGALVLTESTIGTCDNAISGTTASATASSEDDCSTSNKDVWYTFVPSETNNYNISVTETFDSGSSSTYLSVFEGGCGALTQVGTACYSSSGSFALTAGSTYYINVRSTSSTGDVNFDLCAALPPPPPANDDCAGAVALMPGLAFGDNPVDGTVASAMDDTVPVGCGSDGPGVWYSVVVPNDGNITIETGPNSGATTGFDSVIEAFSGVCGTLVSIACDDDSADTGNYSKLDLTGLAPGTTIYIRVWEYGGDESEPFSISAHSTTLSIPTSEFEGFSYYPNPVNSSLKLKAQQQIQNVAVYNMLGQEVLKTAPNMVATEVDMSALQTGTYFVKVTVNDATKTIKVIKN